LSLQGIVPKEALPQGIKVEVKLDDSSLATFAIHEKDWQKTLFFTRAKGAGKLPWARLEVVADRVVNLANMGLGADSRDLSLAVSRLQVTAVGDKQATYGEGWDPESLDGEIGRQRRWMGKSSQSLLRWEEGRTRLVVTGCVAPQLLPQGVHVQFVANG